MTTRVEWDEDKRLINLHKHGFDFADAWQIFEMPMLTQLDEQQEYGEDSWIGTGMLNTTVVVAVFTEPGEDTIRMISLRKALAYERARYEEAYRDELGKN